MDYLALRIIEKILIVYFAIYLLIDISLFIYSFFVFRRKRKQNQKKDYDFEKYPVSLLVPAYNEEVSIADCVEMLMQIDYPDYELIVINDGSSDNTMQELLDNFEIIESKERIATQIRTQNIKSVWKSSDNRLIVLDKENGGKADAVNAGINYSSKDFICTIDADSILDKDSLKAVITPFIENPDCLVSGGQLAASNDVTILDSQVVSSRTPKNIWALWQISEYIKSFMVSRIGLSKINALLIMSGAFSMYRKADLLTIGGFLSRYNDHPYIEKHLGTGKQTVCEDMEIVVRLYHYRRNRKLKSKLFFMPRPICWTEVPENGKFLFRQRSRWHQGLAETLKIHSSMIFEPKYGSTGMIGLPYYFFFELFAPVIKVFTIIFLIVSAVLGTINYEWLILLLVSIILITTIIISSITAVIENWSMSQSRANRDALRYKGFFDWIWLIFASILGEFSYSFFKIGAQLNGIYSFLRGRSDWKKFERKGVLKR